MTDKKSFGIQDRERKYEDNMYVGHWVRISSNGVSAAGNVDHVDEEAFYLLPHYRTETEYNKDGSIKRISCEIVEDGLPERIMKRSLILMQPVREEYFRELVEKSGKLKSK